MFMANDVRDINEAIVWGEVTSGPFEHETKSKKKIVRFSLTTKAIRGDETYIQHHSITAWGDDAEWVLGNVKIGQRVYVKGEMRTRSFPTKDGTKGYSFEVVAIPVRVGGILITGQV